MKNIQIIRVVLGALVCLSFYEAKGSLLTTMNWPAPVAQPGYQLALLFGTSSLLEASFQGAPGDFESSDAAFWNGSHIFGFSNIQTIGYYAASTTSLPLIRPPVNVAANYTISWGDILFVSHVYSRYWWGLTSRYGGNIGAPKNMSKPTYANLTAWPYNIFYPNGQNSFISNLFNPCDFNSNTTYYWNYIGPIYSFGDGYYDNYMTYFLYTLNTGIQKIFNAGQLSPNSSHTLLEQNYYSNPIGNLDLCAFNNDNPGNRWTFSSYCYSIAQDINQNQDTLRSIATATTSNSSPITLKNFTSLPGSNGNSAENYFMDLFVSYTYFNDNPTFSFSTYTSPSSGNETVYLASGNCVYAPLFLTDPGNPYYPLGWNYATADTPFDPEKHTLMTNFYGQLNSSLSASPLASMQSLSGGG